MVSRSQIATLSTVLAVSLVSFRVYKRVRRSIGRQRLSLWRTWVSAVLLPVMLVLLLMSAAHRPVNALVELGGIAIGALLGVYGLRSTKFEPTGDGFFYTPNAAIGLILSALFIGRIAWRLFAVYSSTGGFTVPIAETIKSPATVFIVGLLAGHYSIYAFGLLRWHRNARRGDGLAGGEGVDRAGGTGP